MMQTGDFKRRMKYLKVSVERAQRDVYKLVSG